MPTYRVSYLVDVPAGQDPIDHDLIVRAGGYDAESEEVRAPALPAERGEPKQKSRKRP